MSQDAVLVPFALGFLLLAGLEYWAIAAWLRRRSRALLARPKTRATICLTGLPTSEPVPGAYVQIDFAAPARRDLAEHVVPCLFPTGCGRCDPIDAAR